ncbi:MAG: DUF1501 domain-containing protein [Pseudomonadota bacterium]
MCLTRRAFLKDSLATSIAMASLGGVSTAMNSIEAKAANTEGYGALVCLFLFGGLDNHDMVLPYDSTSYNQFVSLRGSLLQAQGDSRARSSLLSLSTADNSQFGSRRFALPPELAGIKGLYDRGHAAIVGNVGPLLQPTNRGTFEQESVPLPARLFSHNDQQATWQASAPEGASFGWGGRFVDALLPGNGSADFSAISSFGDGLFLTGQQARPYNVNPGGAATQEVLEALELEGNTQALAAARAFLRGENYRGVNFFAQDMRNAARASIDANRLYNAAVNEAQPILTEFPGSALGLGLRAVAEAINLRTSLQVNRQVFFVGLGGFDTHSGQAQTLPELLRTVDSAVTAFHSEMERQGLSQSVTLFTASDFGRTLIANGDGTDHGWGGHQFVIGGSVQGGAIYGDLPPIATEHEQDSGNGRLIPTTSVEQFAAPMGRWLGLNDSELNQALPNLSNFPGDSALGFL